MQSTVTNALIRIFGFVATVLFGDPAVFDRWLWLRRNIQGGPIRTLDAGCGSGAFAMYAAKKGNETVGISFDGRNNKVAAERARILNIKNARFITGDLRRLDTVAKELGTFDQIICFETIEHILDDKKLIKDFVNLLKSGGRLLLTTPYKNYKHLPGDGVSRCEDGGHVRWGYTHEEMRLLLGEFGLKTVAEEYISGYVSQLLIRIDRVLAAKTHPIFAWGIIFPLRIFQFLSPILDKIIGYPFLSIGVVAVKR